MHYFLKTYYLCVISETSDFLKMGPSPHLKVGRLFMLYYFSYAIMANIKWFIIPELKVYDQYAIRAFYHIYAIMAESEFCMKIRFQILIDYWSFLTHINRCILFVYNSWPTSSFFLSKAFTFSLAWMNVIFFWHLKIYALGQITLPKLSFVLC